ncbi:MAG: hypothetical protein VW874_09740 [Gammaproteobacteria bacterium]
MQNSLTINLSHSSADESWSEHTLYTQQDNRIIIHTPDTDNALVRIQKAGRQLAANGLLQPHLEGPDWGIEEQWAFAQGYYSPQHREAPLWAADDPEVVHELQSRFIASVGV